MLFDKISESASQKALPTTDPVSFQQLSTGLYSQATNLAKHKPFDYPHGIGTNVNSHYIVTPSNYCQPGSLSLRNVTVIRLNAGLFVQCSMFLGQHPALYQLKFSNFLTAKTREGLGNSS